MQADREHAEKVKDLAGKLVQFIAIVFAVVIAESFARYSSWILHPEWCLALVGLAVVYFTTISSWVRYHRSAADWPYRICRWTWWRFGSDFLIVLLYAYLLYSLQEIKDDANLIWYLWGFVAIFIMYVLTGIFRILEQENRKASNLKRLGLFLISFLFVVMFYQFVVREFFLDDCPKLNWLFLVIPLLLNLTFTYRWWRGR